MHFAFPKTPRALIHWLLCLAFGAVFIYSGVVKWRGIGLLAFADDIRSFHVLSDPWVAWLAMALPCLEFICGAAVVLGLMRRGGLLILSLCLLGFLAALIQAQVRGINVSCGCFGETSGSTDMRNAMIRDLILLSLGAYLFWQQRRSSARSSPMAGGLG